jgi:periplasmic divalent cation tolerance protein
VEIVTTVATDAQAVQLGRTLLAEGLVACASLDPVRSLYRWRGELADEPEVRLALKTTAARADAAAQRLRELHPYETPAILRLEIARANADYAAWVDDATR